MNGILVAGGGLAGTATAIALAQAGQIVTLIEREAAPTHKICGEFLSTEAQTYLRQLGFDCHALGGARITHVRLIRGSQSITAKLPFEGLGLTRKILDENLLRHAAAAGVELRRGHAIQRISYDGGFRVEIDRAPALHPKTLFLATGKHDARGLARGGSPSGLVGFKTYFQLDPAQALALSGHVELFLFPGGYAGLQLVEHGQANFCLMVQAALLNRLGGKFSALLAHLQSISPVLATRLRGAVALLPAPLSIARVPYGFVHHPRAADYKNMFRLGDQAAVIPSFTGDGMAIALHSAALAPKFFLQGQSSASYHARLAQDVGPQIKNASRLYAALSSLWAGPALFALARLFPQSLSLGAALTRVPQSARLPGPAYLAHT